MGREILAGSKDHRQAIKALMDEGWTVSKTNGNHLRLEHPQASGPVFSSSTPSCGRAIKKMEADCRRALRVIEPQIQTTPIEPPWRKVIDDAPRKRRKPRHRDMLAAVMGAARKSGEGFDFAIDAAQSAISSAALNAASPFDLELTSQPGKADAKKATPKSRHLSARDPKVIPPEKVGTTLDTGHAIDQTTTKKETDMSLAELKIATSHAAPEAPETPLIVEPVSVSHALLETLLEIQRGEHDRMMALAQRIHRGELKPITVTPDMVGSTIWVSSDAVVAAPAVTSAPDGKPKKPRAAWEDRFALLEGALTREWVTLNEILALVGKEGLDDSGRQVYRDAMRKAADAGLVERMAAVNSGPKRFRALEA